MVNFVILNPNGDCTDGKLPLKGKDLEKDVVAILKKRCADPNVVTTDPGKKAKTVPLIHTIIKNLGETKLEEVAQWRLSEDYKLIGFGFPEKKRKSKAKSSSTEKFVQNGHELPPCKNATNVYG